MLKLVIIGNLGADAELRNANGAQFLSFRVAHSDRWTDRISGEVHDNTTWVSCTLNGDGGNLRPYLKQGTKVFVYGDVSTRVYVSPKDGKQYAGIDCRVRQIELCGGNQGVPQYTVEGIIQFINVCPADVRKKITDLIPF